MPSVTQIQGERGRFYVESDKEGHQPYLVDLLENDGDGHCSCSDFEIRVLSNRKNGTGRRFCKHLARAMTYFGWQMAKEISQKMRRK